MSYLYRPAYGAQGVTEWGLFDDGLAAAEAELIAGNSHRVLVTNAHGLVYTGNGTGGGLDADKLDGYHAASFALTAHGHTTHSGMDSYDDHIQYVRCEGRYAGQSIKGGAYLGESLSLISTADATRGFIYFGYPASAAYDDVNGRLGVGITVPVSVLDVRGPCNLPSVPGYGILNIYSNDAQAANEGGTITLGGKYTDAGASAYFAGIAGLKENSTTGEYGGYLAFYTRAHGASPAERVRINSGGTLLLMADGSGAASTVGLTNATNTTLTNAYVVKGGQAASTINTGWLKVYIGTAAAWIPYWTNATP